MSENQRLKIFRKHLRKNQTEFAKDLGVKQNSISVMESEGSTITDNIKKMLNVLFGLNIEWLETGVGLINLMNLIKPNLTKYLCIIYRLPRGR